MRWDQFHDLLTRQEWIDRGSGVTTGWAPPVDVLETPDRYHISVEVPGLSRGQIQIQIHDGTLTIEGERPAPDASCEQYHCVERGHGRFSRSFLLPEPIDADAVGADLRDGVLTIRIPKTQLEPRRVEVR